MSAASPARRVRGRFMSLGFWTSAAAFVATKGDALLQQKGQANEIRQAEPGRHARRKESCWA